MKTYEFSTLGLQQAIKERHEEKERYIGIVGLSCLIGFGFFISAVNPIAGYSVIAFTAL